MMVPNTWVPASHMGDQGEVLSCWLLAFSGIWEVKQWMGSLFLPFSSSGISGRGAS